MYHSQKSYIDRVRMRRGYQYGRANTNLLLFVYCVGDINDVLSTVSYVL